MRDTIQLECKECKRKNYTASRNKRIKQSRMEIKKYCKWDRRHTLHKETR
ncbi:MAG: 50S ribosomal protein L33 [SAR324 cluster bacterium]|nr:50S ribosomal protein L33 [SAR324 cluster bacterium]